MQLSCSGCFSAMVGLYRSLLFLGLVSIALPVVAAGPLRINTGFTPPVSGLLEQIMIEAFKRVDVEMSFYELPAERSLKLVVSGVDDGDCCRIPRAIRRDYPGLIRVPESVYVARFSAFAKRPVPEVLSWNDLKPYNVATVTGWKIIVNNLRRVSPATTHVVDHPQSMFEMLQRDRIDIASFGYLSGLWRLKQQGLDREIEVIDPPLAAEPLYLYLHPKHEGLAPRLATVLRKMKREGLIEQLTMQVLEKLPLIQ